MAGETTLIFDTELSSASYINFYTDEPGIQGPLWGGLTVPVVGVCGQLSAGKTTFLLDIAGGPVKRVGVSEEMLKSHPAGYKPLDIFEWWYAKVKSIPAGRFRVIAVDVAEDIEQGLAEWVWEHPIYFNHTKQQYIKMSGMYWGDVNSFWKLVLADVSARCETFAFANHIGSVWGADGKPTDKTKAKGKRVLRELASLYIMLAKTKDPQGNVSAAPAGSVDNADGGKSRLITKAMRNGAKVRVPALPPRFPVATPDAIRQYIINPPDYAALRDSERAPDRQLSEDERMERRIEAARAEAEAERLRIDRIQQERHERHNEAIGGSTPGAAVTVTGGEGEAAHTPADEPVPLVAAPPAGDPEPSHNDKAESVLPVAVQKMSCTELFDELGAITKASYDVRQALLGVILGAYGVPRLVDLSRTQAIELKTKLVAKLRAAYAEQSIQCPF